MVWSHHLEAVVERAGSSTSCVTLTELPEPESGKLLGLIHSNKLFKRNKHWMLVLILRNMRRQSYWCSVYKKPGGKQHGFCGRGALFLEVKPLLGSCATISNLPIPSAFRFCLLEIINPSPPYCRNDRRELNKRSFNMHTTFCLVEG